MDSLIGRKEEIERLNRCLTSGRSEFVILYGRRRVGKTFLVRQFFNNRFCFNFVGNHKETTRVQLNRFASELQLQFGLAVLPSFNDWNGAFSSLQRLTEAIGGDERKVIFFDELPWMDTSKSRFVAALENFWNAWAAHRSDIMFVACGSSTSWMVDKILGNKGGLHGRVTEHIYLRAFTLGECEQMIESKHGQWDRYQTAQAYMALGGIPFYFDLLDVNQSLAHNLNRLFFGANSRLAIEFNLIYDTLFANSENYKKVTRVLASHTGGLTRNKISEQTGLSGGNLTTVLDNLVKCDIVSVFNMFHSKNKAIYYLTDLYTLFYYRFIAGNNTKDERYWSNHFKSPAVYNWQGHAFEVIGLIHIEQIKKKLGISGVATSCYSWHDEKAQIDLVIERADRMINLCEMKFSESEYEITKAYGDRLRNKAAAFRAATRTRCGLLTTLVTTFGVTRGKYAYMAQNEITLDDLFA